MARQISVEIVGDASSLEKAFKKSSKSAAKFGSDMSKSSSRTKSSFGVLTKGVLGLAGGFVGAAGLAGAARAAFSEMADAQKVSAQTAAVLKSTGEAAQVSAKHVDVLANSLLNMSGVDDELIKSAENVLLTFRGIRNEQGKGNKIFDKATKAALDMSVALGTDLQGSAIQIGKALQDPVKGITALQRVGVSFTAGQRNQIKALAESNHTLEAQRLILRELQKEFGGSAKAAGQTLPGQLNKLHNQLLNVGGAIAQTLSPEITKLAEHMTKWLSKSKNQKQVLDNVQAATEAAATAARALSGAFSAMNKVTGSAKHTFELLLAGFVTFKSLKLAAYIAKMAESMQAFAIASGEANAAGMGGGPAGKAAARGAAIKSLGRATIVGAAGVAAYEGAGLLGAGKLGREIGGAFYDVTHRSHRTLRTPQDVKIYLDGREIAAVTARHNENEMLRRSKQRTHQRRGTR